MIRQSALALVFIATCAAAQPAAPDAAASAPPLHLSGPVCRHGIFGFHFKTDGASEGNVYIPLMEISRICRESADDEAPQPQRAPHEPLPKAQRL